ncbi:MAG: Sjogren's syndrome/scleroderma autoantigen 1 family protein [Candidatus Thorarchaeota archaeon]
MSDENITKRMGQLLRKGAALLNIACPKCNTPLLRLKDGTMYCTKCDIEVVEQRANAQSSGVASSDVLNLVASKVLMNLDSLTRALPDKPHPEEIRAFASIVKDLIEILRGIRELQG